ncbi:hypothetical protein [Lewinella sp. 4G2]|uniref:hypothetical protein n=1 Tax=Lewinella sp. 4G2 TaxID=1803372 RepID=UPI0007B47F84|nr:hypothetical protein [Lewinella sp. 4G2]OAV46094.1 hypothetical protein A3850_017680 [Lewinella sp. 4G2]
MKVFHFITAAILLITCAACGGDAAGPPEEGAGFDTEMTPEIDSPNEDNTDIYDVDPEDPYLISNGTFLGLKPGEPLGAYAEVLRKGRLKDGEGSFDVYYIDGAEGSKLGYLMPDPLDKNIVGDIYVTSPAVVTEKGIRVGTTYEELVERIGAISFHGSEIESRVYGNKEGISYRLDMTSADYDLDNSRISPETAITEIVISRKQNM